MKNEKPVDEIKVWRYLNAAMKITPKQIETLRHAAKILNSITGDLYDEIVDAGFQPSTAGGTTGEIASYLETRKSNEIRIKAMWTNYGPRLHHAGKNTDCVGDHSSWTLAGYDLQNWIERNHPGATPIFYGSSAESAKQGWEESSR